MTLAEVFLAPVFHLVEDREEILALIGQAVLDVGRDLIKASLRKYFSFLEAIQSLGEGTRAYAGQGALELAKALRLVGQLSHDKARPLVPNDG